MVLVAVHPGADLLRHAEELQNLPQTEVILQVLLPAGQEAEGILEAQQAAVQVLQNPAVAVQEVQLQQTNRYLTSTKDRI